MPIPPLVWGREPEGHRLLLHKAFVALGYGARLDEMLPMRIRRRCA